MCKFVIKHIFNVYSPLYCIPHVKHREFVLFTYILYTSSIQHSAYNMVRWMHYAYTQACRPSVSGTWLIQHSKQDDALESKKSDS